MLRQGFVLSCLMLSFACLATHALADAPAKRPNIIIIMSDDMGYSDLGCYGGEIQTPVLDTLAKDGVRFTQFYNTARCCPTRASLLTGLYPHQAGIGHMTNDRGHDGYRGNLSKQAVTIAEVLKPAGYRTYMCGKWHVTSQTRIDGDRSNWPVQRGFEKFYGTLFGAGSFYDPATLCRQNEFITCQNDPEYQPEEYYYTTALADNAVKYLQEHKNESPDAPFFMYVAFTAAHWPMHALEKDIAKYKGKFDDGYHQHRLARLERMKSLGVITPNLELTAGAEDWDAVKDKEWEARCMEVYSAMIDSMDAGIGRIVSQLKASGELDNTLILFLQDNGACAENMGRSDNGNGPKNLKAFSKDDLQPKGSPPMQTRDGKWVKQGPGVMPGPADTYIAYGRGWANVSNTPFREYKHWVHEGGISTPLIAHWPAGIQEQRRGELEHQPGHLIDLMATCVDLSGAPYPEEFAGQKIQPREGVTLRPAFNGQSLERPEPIYWEHEGNRAIRDGKWKLVAKENQPWELYDISVDRIESNNLVEKEPELARKLAAQWEAYAARAKVLPLGTWRGDAGGDDKGPAKNRFELTSGQTLQRGQAPAIANRSFVVTAKIEVADEKAAGVVVAQGGSALGFTIYLQDGKPVFALRSPDQVFKVEGKTALTKGEHTIKATLTPKKRLQLIVDGEPVSDEVDAVFLAKKPVDGLQVGEDTGGAVGEYESPFEFTGTVKSVLIQLQKVQD